MMFVVSTYSSIFPRIDGIHRSEHINFVHNKSIAIFSNFLSIENCHGKLATSVAFRSSQRLHKLNKLKMFIDLKPHISLDSFTSYKISFISLDLKKNLKSFSYGYMFNSRLTNKCFGIIY